MRWLTFPRVLGIIVCLYLVLMSAVFGLLANQNYQFVHNATRTTGTVVALVPRMPAGSARNPDARTISTAPTIRYEVLGKTYEYTAAHGRYHQRLKIGQQVTVLYNPANPGQARMRGEGTVLVPGITAGFVVSALIVAGVLWRTRRLSAAPSKTAERTH